MMRGDLGRVNTSNSTRHEPAMVSASHKPTLCTIGYEDAVLEDFITTLQASGVARVVDVRAVAASMDKDLEALKPCPYSFKFQYRNDANQVRNSTCDDWETVGMFWNFSRRLGEEKALEAMSKTFNEEYPSKGMLFAMGTHSRFPTRWLLVGVLRADPIEQLGFAL